MPKNPAINATLEPSGAKTIGSISGKLLVKQRVDKRWFAVVAIVFGILEPTLSSATLLCTSVGPQILLENVAISNATDVPSADHV